MKRSFSFFIIVVLLFCLPAFAVSAEQVNIIPQAECTMSENSQWGAKFGGTVTYETVPLRGDTSNKALCFIRENGKSKSWHSPTLNIADYLKRDTEKNGDGIYKIEFDFCIIDDSEKSADLGCKFRTDIQCSFAEEPSGDNTEYRGNAGRISAEKTDGTWYHYIGSFSCKKDDFEGMKSALFCFDAFSDTVTRMYLDNFTITGTDSKNATAEKETVTEIENEEKIISSDRILIAKKPMLEFEIESGENLLSKENSRFDVKNIDQTDWTKLDSAQLSIDGGGVDGNCLFADNIKNSWSSPMLDISPYITSSGTYSFGMIVQLDVDDSDAHSVTVMIRGKDENSFIKKRGGNYYNDGVKYNFKNGLWIYTSFEIDVTEEDILQKNSKTAWNVALSGLPDGTKSIRIDNAELIYGTKEMLSQDGTDKIKELNKEANKIITEDRAQNQQKVTLDKSFYDAIKNSLIITVVIVAVVIFIKIRKAKK